MGSWTGDVRTDEGQYALLTRSQIGPFVWVAWAGVVTTALNTLVPLATPEIAGELESRARL